MNIEILKNMSVENLIYTATFAISAFIAIAAIFKGIFNNSLILKILSGVFWAVVLGLAFGALQKLIYYIIFHLNENIWLLNLFQNENFYILCGSIIGFILGTTSCIYEILKHLVKSFLEIKSWRLKFVIGIVIIVIVIYIVHNIF